MKYRCKFQFSFSDMKSKQQLLLGDAKIDLDDAATLLNAKDERIAKLEKEVKQYKVVENWVRSFTIDELEAHNLEQQANGIMDFKKWVLDTDQNSSDIDVRDINLIEFYVEPLISQAKALKEQG